jgi:hypothetical protein
MAQIYGPAAFRKRDFAWVALTVPVNLQQTADELIE